MMRKKVNYTHCTPIPSYIPRQLALDILHSHGEIITLNPLVTHYQPTQAPRDAPSDEYYSTWYEIEERIQFVPGAGRMGSGKIKFNGCFHDLAWGLQTHIYAPMKVDLKNNWRIAGNQPDEPRETTEMGIGAPSDGLYLREDVEIKCNITMVSFVKKEMMASSKVLVDRLIKKAELLDAGVLLAMMENGKLKTVNPADRSSASQNPPQSPGMPPSPYNKPLPLQPYSTSQQGQQNPYPQSPGRYAPSPHMQQPQQAPVVELPADYHYPSQDHKTALLHPADLHPAHRHSAISELSGGSPVVNDARWSSTASDYQPSALGSRPTSYATDTSGMRSPRIDHGSFGAVPEIREELDGTSKVLEHGRPDRSPPQAQPPRYNPQDYART